jgi:hypothetical protein
MKTLATLATTYFVLCSVVIQQTHAQPPPGVSERMAKLEKENLAAPYKGVAASIGIEKGLFSIRSTGVSTKPIKKAVDNFLQSLSKDQLAKTQYEVQDQEWQKWSNVDNGLYKRQGVSIKELSPEQRELAFAIMRVSLSAKGLKMSKDIMKTDHTLRELNDNNPIYDEELYFFTVMGKPSMTDPWGWQIDGHHLVVNYFILGDQIVMTPVFMGAEPVLTTTGKYNGNIVFQDEQNIGLTFMQSFSLDQQTQATISADKTRSDIQAEAFKDNKTIDFQGLCATSMSEDQKKEMLNLAHLYISNMTDEHAAVKMEEIIKHIDNTYFAWIGKTGKDAVFYYRIHSPVILIEFDHQGPIGIKGEGKVATRNHIHTVVRTPNGNDYGKDLLRQHLLEHHSQK